MINRASFLKNRMRGAKAQAVGAQFESLFVLSARLQRIAVSRIADGCKRIGPRDFIPLKQPFDWILSYAGKAAVVDTKSTISETFRCSAIDPNQLRELSRHGVQGIIAGYVVRSTKLKEFFFIPWNVLQAKSLLKRGSISAHDPGVVHLGNDTHPNLKAIFEPTEGMWPSGEVNQEKRET